MIETSVPFTPNPVLRVEPMLLSLSCRALPTCTVVIAGSVSKPDPSRLCLSGTTLLALPALSVTGSNLG